MSDARQYLPAAGHDWLLPLYDPVAWLMGAAAAHRQLIEQARLAAGHRVLEIGCGTGNLLVAAKRLHPDVDVVGLDPDPKALARAARKARRQGVAVRLDRGFADALPYPDAAYDRVLSALMLHHLERAQKERALHEVRRVLKPGGSVHVVDFGATHGHADGWFARLVHRHDHFRDNDAATILGLLRAAGLVDAEALGQRRTPFGRVSYYRATRGA
jgi:ubiquinone/menaquinone biosynthesis C-methylase UbiE